MPFLKRAGKPTLHYEVDDNTDPWRNAPVLILQHGFGRSAKFWYRWLPYLSRFYRVVRPELRGQGQSPVEFDPYRDITVDNYIGDLLAIIAEVGGGPVHYCGESFGGILGMVLAAEHPTRVRTLSLVAAPLTISNSLKLAWACGYGSLKEALQNLGPTAWAEKTNASTRFPPGTDQGLIDWYAREIAKCNPDVMVALFDVACKADASAYLSRISVPTLGLYPSGGRITGPEEEIIRTTMKDKGMRYVSFPTEYHSIQFMLPAACATNVLHFAAQYDGMPCRE